MDFNRKPFKKAALDQLKGRWGTAVISGLIFFAVYLFVFAPLVFTLIRVTLANNTGNTGIEESAGFFVHFFIVYFLTLLILAVIIPIVSMAYIYVISQYAKTSEKLSISQFFRGFTLWAKGLGGFWHKGIHIFLWALLAEIIGGIVIFLVNKAGGTIATIFEVITEIVIFIFILRKSLSYSLNIYLLADNPNLKVTEALDLSIEYTEDNLWDLFVLDLSFLGWYYLSILTVGIGLLWLAPYYFLTEYNVAMYLKDETEKLYKQITDEKKSEETNE